MNKKLKGIISSVIILVIGVVMLISGIHSYTTRNEYDTTTKAKIVDIQEELNPTAQEDENQYETKVYITYEVNGVKYEHVESPVINPGMNVGDEIEILYKSSDPSKIASGNVGTTSIIFIAAGGVASVVAVVVFIKGLRTR